LARACSTLTRITLDKSPLLDSVSHDWLNRFVEHRIGDPRVIRLIRKWLKAGVMEDWVVKPTEVQVCP
jgi:retron-type reverse transcriptase